MGSAISPTAPSVDFRQRDFSLLVQLRLRQLAFGRQNRGRSVSPLSDRPDQVFGRVVEESGASRLRELETEEPAPVGGGLGQQGDSQLHRVPRRTKSNGLSVQTDLCLVGLRDAKEHLCKLRVTRANQAKETQNSACPDVEVNVLHDCSTGESAHAEDWWPNLCIFFRKEGGGFSADHVTNGLFRTEIGGRRRDDPLA